jgi:serine/threonine protein kinase
MQLGKSLYEFLKQNEFRGFPYSCVIDFAYQLFQALSFLKSISLIHTDLKPENILLVKDGFTVSNMGSYDTKIPLDTRIKRKVKLFVPS